MKLLKIIAIFLLIINVSNCLKAQDSLRISVLTCANGGQIYSSFGHSAIRVVDPEKNFDVIFNYGTFNFKVEGFYVKFVRGFLNYYLSTPKTSRFHQEYTKEKRRVIEQELNLTKEQKIKMLEFLIFNAKEENKYYKYDFLTDNCATRIYDVLGKACENQIEFPNQNYNTSARDEINLRLSDMPWIKAGVNLLMGLPVDKKLNSKTATFLPDYILLQLNLSKVNINGQMEPLVKEQNVWVDMPDYDRTDFTTHFSPLVFFSIIAIIVLFFTLKEFNNKVHYQIIDKIFFWIFGIISLLLCFMWFFTDHTVTAWNLNILWAFPLDLIAVFKIKNPQGFFKKYFLVCMIICAILLVSFPFFVQNYDISFFPIILIRGVRCFRLAYNKFFI